MTTSEIFMICFTAVIATAGVIGSVIFNNQLRVMEGQLGEMKTASQIAQTEADAARKSAETAERALIAGQRAFVSASSFIPCGHLNAKAKIIAWSFAPTWVNAGDTPTRNLTNHINLLSFKGAIPKDWDFPDLWNAKSSPEEREAIPLGIAPKGSITGQSVGVSVGSIAQVIKGERSLYMWGWAKYNDVFPGTRQHVTRFAVQIIIGGNASNKDKISFNFQFLSKYGCSDEECDYQGHGPEWIPRQITLDPE